MFIIESGNYKNKWISGVFLNQNDAIKYINTIKNSLSNPYIVPIKIDKYPLYAYRINESAFVYMNHEELLDYFRDHDTTEEDRIYGELYTIEKDYFTYDYDLMCEVLNAPNYVTNGFINYLRTTPNNISINKSSI